MSNMGTPPFRDEQAEDVVAIAGNPRRTLEDHRTMLITHSTFSHEPGAFARRLRRMALAIGLLGGTAAVALYVGAHQDPDIPELGHGSISEQRELQQLERMGGKAALLILEFQRGFESLWVGERLAGSVAVLTILAAWLCLHLAALADEDSDDEPGAKVERRQ